MFKLLLVVTALWLTLEVAVSKHSMQHNTTCSEVSWCMGNRVNK